MSKPGDMPITQRPEIRPLGVTASEAAKACAMTVPRFKSTCPLIPVAIGNRKVYLWADVEEWFTRWHSEKQSAKPSSKCWVDEAYGSEDESA